jgi:thioredoxin reductase
VYDVLVVGGGPAGLSAALLLGRSRRSVLLCDAGEPRNAASHAAHSFLTRDGTPPAELRRIAREQVAAYPSVELSASAVVAATADDGRFTAVLSDGQAVAARAVVLATGVRDELPAIDGFAEMWGTSVFHCPYCDGWEVRDQPLAVYANGADAESTMTMTSLIRHWSRDLVLLTDGPAPLDAEQRGRLAALRVELREAPVARLEGERGQLQRIVFTDGSSLARSALFVRPRQHPRTELAAALGCALSDGPPLPGLLQIDAMGQTTVPGVYAAGDIVSPMQQITTAVATGALAGAMINHTLIAIDD